MLKKVLLVVLVLLALLLFVSYLRASQGADSSPQPELLVTATPVSPTPAPTPTPDPTPTLTPEEYDAMIANEIEELKNEAPLLDEEGTEIPTLNVSDNETVEIAENETVGGM